jgi:hypothetical protein
MDDNFRSRYQGNFNYHMDKDPVNYRIVHIAPRGINHVSQIIAESEHAGLELKAYIESPMPHGSHSMPSLLIFKKNEIPELKAEIRELKEIIENTWYNRLIRWIKAWKTQ